MRNTSRGVDCGAGRGLGSWSRSRRGGWCAARSDGRRALGRPSNRGLLPRPVCRRAQFCARCRWILFSLTTRVEENQGSRSESFVVPTDAAHPPAGCSTRRGRDRCGVGGQRAARYTSSARGRSIPPIRRRRREEPRAGRGGGRGGRGGGRGGPGAEGGAGRDAESRWTLDHRAARRAAPAAGGAGAHGLRAASRRSFPRRDVRLDGVPARRSGVSRAELTDRPAQQVTLQSLRGGDRAEHAHRSRRPSHGRRLASGRQLRRVPRRHDLARRAEGPSAPTSGSPRSTAPHAAHRRRLRPLDLDFSPDGKYCPTRGRSART